MENHMMIFKNPAFGEVRTIKGENNTPWFVGNDVAKALGYKNFRDALSRHVDEEDKGPLMTPVSLKTFSPVKRTCASRLRTSRSDSDG